MNTIPYLRVLQATAEMAGRVYADGEGNIVLTNEEANSLRVFIRRALVNAWESVPWPELMQIERRTFAAPYNRDASYNAGDIVWMEGPANYWVALKSVPTYSPPAIRHLDTWTPLTQWAVVSQTYDAPEWSVLARYGQSVRVHYDATSKYYQSHLPVAPATHPEMRAVWGELPLWRQHIAWVQDWEFDPIGDVFGVFQTDPRASRAREIEFEGTSLGLLIREPLPYVWIRHRAHPPSLAVDPATLPFRFGDYCSLYAAGLMLRVDGKVDLGNQYLSLAADALQAEHSKALKYDGEVRRVQIHG